MKKSIIIIICLLMSVGFVEISYAQDVVQEVPVITADQQQAVDDIIAMDPKLSAEEIEQFKIAVLGAPAKAQELTDPKLDSQPEFTLAPVNAEPIEERELLLAQPVNPGSITTTQTGIQPEPTRKVELIHYRKLKGPSTQPQSITTSVKDLNYRSIKGPGTQPISKPGGN